MIKGLVAFASDGLHAHTGRPVFSGTLWALCRSSDSHRKQGIGYFLPILARCTPEIQNGYKWIVQFWLNIDIFQVILSLFGLFCFGFLVYFEWSWWWTNSFLHKNWNWSYPQAICNWIFLLIIFLFSSCDYIGCSRVRLAHTGDKWNNGFITNCSTKVNLLWPFSYRYLACTN